LVKLSVVETSTISQLELDGGLIGL
jgi:hypothetical protein